MRKEEIGEDWLFEGKDCRKGLIGEDLHFGG
jgi:hypothetical protein